MNSGASSPSESGMEVTQRPLPKYSPYVTREIHEAKLFCSVNVGRCESFIIAADDTRYDVPTATRTPISLPASKELIVSTWGVGPKQQTQPSQGMQHMLVECWNASRGEDSHTCTSREQLFHQL